MAVITDTLRTIIQLQGAAEYSARVREMAAETGAFAARMNTTAATATALAANVTAVATAVIAFIQAGQMAVSVLEGIARAAISGMQAFGRYNDELVRTQLLFRNMGGNLGATPGPLAAFALQRQQQALIPEGQTLELARRVRMTGVSEDLVPRFVQTLQNLESSGRMSADRAIDVLQRFSFRETFGAMGGRGGGSMGGIRALANLAGGINPMLLTGDPRRDELRILDQIDRKLGGMSEALRASPEGSLTAVQQNFQTLMNQLFGILETMLMPALNLLALDLQIVSQGLLGVEFQLAKMPDALATVLSVFLHAIPGAGGIIGGAFDALRQMGQGFLGPDAASKKEQQEQTFYLRQIAQRPASVQFGHLGPESQTALSFLSFSEALSVRPT